MLFMLAIIQISEELSVSKTVATNQSLLHVDWIQINPPPNSDGPCYIYMINETQGAYGALGYSGIWCN